MSIYRINTLPQTNHIGVVFLTETHQVAKIFNVVWVVEASTILQHRFVRLSFVVHCFPTPQRETTNYQDAKVHFVLCQKEDTKATSLTVKLKT